VANDLLLLSAPAPIYGRLSHHLQSLAPSVRFLVVYGKHNLAIIKTLIKLTVEDLRFLTWTILSINRGDA
jgi:hypothetical protein